MIRNYLVLYVQTFVKKNLSFGLVPAITKIVASGGLLPIGRKGEAADVGNKKETLSDIKVIIIKNNIEFKTHRAVFFITISTILYNSDVFPGHTRAF